MLLSYAPITKVGERPSATSLSVAVSSQRNSRGAPVRGMRPDDVYRLTNVGDPRLSPDARTVAYVRAWVDDETHEPRSAIWSVPVDGATSRDSSPPARSGTGRLGGHPTAAGSRSRRRAATTRRSCSCSRPTDRGPRQLTRLQEAVEAPVWSPDGSRLAFTSRTHDPNDDEDDASKRPPRRITRLQSRLDHEGWTEGRAHHISVVGLDGARSRSSSPTAITRTNGPPGRRTGRRSPSPPHATPMGPWHGQRRLHRPRRRWGTPPDHGYRRRTRRTGVVARRTRIADLF